LNGQSIASEATPRKEVKISLYLSVGDGNKKFALISGHVAFHEDQENPYRWAEGDPAIHAITPGDVTLVREKRRLMNRWRESAENVVLDGTDITRRRLGQIMFSPTLAPVALEGDLKGEFWLPDYALITLGRGDGPRGMLCVRDSVGSDLIKINRGKIFDSEMRPAVTHWQNSHPYVVGVDQPVRMEV